MVLQEIRRALRNLLHAPRFSLMAIATLAIAVGGAGGLFSLLTAVVLRPITPVAPERLVAVYPANGEALFGITMPTLVELKKRQQVFDDMCGILRNATMIVEVGGSRMTRAGEGVDGVCYQMLGARPLMGRLITEADAPLLGDPADVALVSHAFWTTILASDPGVIGQTLRVRGGSLTIIGVMPAGFHGYNADEAPDIIVPLSLAWKLIGSPSVLALHAVGRLRSDKTLADAQSHLRIVWPDVWNATNPPPPPQRGVFAGAAESLRVESLAGGFSELRRGYAQPLYALVGLAVLLLLLAAVNVGGVCLARTLARGQQLAIAIALGASRRRMATQLSAEAILLAAAAAIASLPIAYWISSGLAAMLWMSARPLTMSVTPDAVVLAAIAGTALAAGVLASMPSVVVGCWRPLSLIGNHGRTVAVASAWWKRSLLVAQISVSLILMFSAGLFVRNLQQIRSIDPGYRTNGLQWARLEPAFGVPRPADEAAYYNELLMRISSLPGVARASIASTFPASEIRHLTALQTFVKDDGSAAEVRGTMDRTWPGFFATVGVPLLSGRDFTLHDNAAAPPVAIVNQSLGDRMFPSGGAVGGRVRLPASKQTLTIVGVVRDVSPGDRRISNHPLVYRPALQALPFPAPSVVIRTASAASLAADVRGVVSALGRHEIASFRTLDEQMERFLIRERALSLLSTSFAGLGLLVGVLGLYGLLAYTVVRRTRELGVRMALGATRGRLVRMILQEGVILTVIGVTVGVPVALAAGRAARALLYDVSPFDAVSLGAAAGVLLFAGVCAAAIPALRAARIRLSDALRYE
jgi:putative ABC transport system permease protein